jgi:hypothetical protein
METRNTLRDLTCRGVIRPGLLVFISLAFIGCAQFQHQIAATTLIKLQQ